MSTYRVWAGRLAALVAAVIIPACGSNGSPGGTNPGGILWVTQGNTNAPQGTLATTYWNNPNSGVVGPIGIQNIITSADDATYDQYAPSGAGGISTTGVRYILGNLHPLSTDTGSISITSRESQLQGQVNGYRQSQLGNVGGGGVNGGVAVGNVQGIILSGHFKATKSARAHCKHYALFHGGFPAAANSEGDALQTSGGAANVDGTPPLLPLGTARKGRLGKIEVTAYVPLAFGARGTGAAPGFTYDGGGSIVCCGTQYSDPGAVFSDLLINVPADIGAIVWTNFAVGHWRGGPAFYYWALISLVNPTPAN